MNARERNSPPQRTLLEPHRRSAGVVGDPATVVYADLDNWRWSIAETTQEGRGFSARRDPFAGVEHRSPYLGGNRAGPVKVKSTSGRTRRPNRCDRPRSRERVVTWVELRGFEPLTPSMRTRCATGLRHSPLRAGPG